MQINSWVFPNPVTRQRWANESKITKRWTRALAAAGIRYRRPYQTRHTYASMMLSAGENVIYVANQMGHADWSMLVRVYGHWIPSGSAQSAGSLVAAAQTQQWQRLDSILQSRPLDLRETDGDDSDDDDETDSEEFGDRDDDFQNEGADAAPRKTGREFTKPCVD